MTKSGKTLWQKEKLHVLCNFFLLSLCFQKAVRCRDVRKRLWLYVTTSPLGLFTVVSPFWQVANIVSDWMQYTVVLHLSANQIPHNTPSIGFPLQISTYIILACEMFKIDESLDFQKDTALCIMCFYQLRQAMGKICVTRRFLLLEHNRTDTM